MTRVYDNWERLVQATLRRDELLRLFHDHSRTPSTGSASSSGTGSDPGILIPEAPPAASSSLSSNLSNSNSGVSSGPSLNVSNSNGSDQGMSTEIKNGKTLKARKKSFGMMRLDRWIWKRWTVSNSVMHSNTTATVALTRRRLYMAGSDQFLNIPKVFAFFRAPARWEMLRTHENWERLVAAVLRSDELWELFHAHSRSPNVLSDASDHSSSFLVKSPESSSSYQNQPESDVAKLRNPDLVFIDGVWSDFGLEDLLRASAEVLGIGTFGRVYATKLDNRMTVVVKRLKLFGITDKDFKRSMEAVGNVRHPNVAALRAYFTSTEEKLLLYDHHSRGSVSDLLHGEPDFHHPPVYWGTRLRIALGAARGISRIHTQNGGKLVHGNIKASNIFLNSEGYGFVSDLGLANMIPTTFMPTARCYAPEVKSTQNVSQASDVYSFGILLLELLAQKSPVQSPSGQEAVDLANLVNVKRKELNSKVFNGDLLLDPATREQAVSMFKVGLICVAKSPKKRPTMSAVVKMIEDIHMPSTGNLYFIYEYRSDTNKLVFFGLGKHTFDQTYLLRGSVDVLGIGTFGASYKLMKMES